jgi:type III pantothenate kinase
MDRLVAAVAANRIRDPQRAAIVVDAGTAVTVDAIMADGSFQGGVILPGMRLVCRALAAGTDLLPLVEVSFSESPPEPIGRSTETAIRSGAFWGTVGAIRLLVSQFRQQLGDSAQVFVTGGDASALASLIDREAQFVPQLVLAGIFWSDK